MPAFAKAGAIIPFATDWRENINQNPREIEILIFPGNDGKFSLYEEVDNAIVWTDFALDWERGMVTAEIRDGKQVDAERKYQFVFPCWKVMGEPEVRVNGSKTVPEMVVDGKAIKLKVVSSMEITSITIDWKEKQQVLEHDYQQEIFDFLKEAQIPYTQKEQIYGLVGKYGRSPLIIQELSALQLGKAVYEVVCELLWAYSG